MNTACFSRIFRFLSLAVVCCNTISCVIYEESVPRDDGPDPLLLIGGKAIATVNNSDVRLTTTNPDCAASLDYGKYCLTSFTGGNEYYDGDWTGSCEYVRGNATLKLGHKTVVQGGFRSLEASWSGVSGQQTANLQAAIGEDLLLGNCAISIDKDDIATEKEYFYGRIDVAECSISNSTTQADLKMYFSIQGCFMF